MNVKCFEDWSTISENEIKLLILPLSLSYVYDIAFIQPHQQHQINPANQRCCRIR